MRWWKDTIKNMGGKSGEIHGGELMQWGGGEGKVEENAVGRGGEGRLRIHTIVLYRDYMFGIKF